MLHPGIMVSQTVEFLFEAVSRRNISVTDQELIPFFDGARYLTLQTLDRLIWGKSFETSEKLFSFDLENIFSAVRKLELHADVSFNIREIAYMADLGSGPNTPLLVAKRMPLGRGVSFEVEERGVFAQSLSKTILKRSSSALLAQRHYSTGLVLLAAEDQVPGLVEAAFMQFYLSIEAILGTQNKADACERAVTNHSSVPSKIVEHVYLARHRFFGHAHPRNDAYVEAGNDPVTAFEIAKQVLVARWCARALISSELKEDLLSREMRLYPNLVPGSVAFNGRVESLTEFALPE